MILGPIILSIITGYVFNAIGYILERDEFHAHYKPEAQMRLFLLITCIIPFMNTVAILLYAILRLIPNEVKHLIKNIRRG